MELSLTQVLEVMVKMDLVVPVQPAARLKGGLQAAILSAPGAPPATEASGGMNRSDVDEALLLIPALLGAATLKIYRVASGGHSPPPLPPHVMALWHQVPCDGGEGVR